MGVWLSLGLMVALMLTVTPPDATAQSPDPTTTTPATIVQAPNPLDEPIDTAWILVNDHRLFEVAEITDIPAKQRAQGINGELAELIESREPLEIVVDISSYTPIIYNAFGQEIQRQILSVTVNDLSEKKGEVTEALLRRQAKSWADLLERGVSQARKEQSEDYLIRAIISALLVLLLALGIYYLLGYLWRRYLPRLLPPVVIPPPPGTTGIGRPQFSLARFSANLFLLGLRLGVGLMALLYVVRLFRVTRSWTNSVQDWLETTFVRESLPLGETALSIADIVALLGGLGGIILLARLATNVLSSRLLHNSGMSLGMQAAISILVRYAILFVGAIAVLQLWGIDLSSLTLLASALGVGLGLGLQNIARDISSGLVLVFERPIQVGDFIELNGRMGIVDRIGPRSTDIRTLDQVSIIVPNSRFLEQDVINWSHRNPLSRIHIPVGVAYGSQPEVVKAVLLDVGRDHPHVMAAPAVEVLLLGFGESALKFELLVWIRKPHRQTQIRSELNFAIATAFNKVGIEIPFPQRDIHLPQSPLQVTLAEAPPSNPKKS